MYEVRAFIFKSTAKGKILQKTLIQCVASSYLTAMLHAMEIEDLTSRVQSLEFTNEEERQSHQ